MAVNVKNWARHHDHITSLWVYMDDFKPEVRAEAEVNASSAAPLTASWWTAYHYVEWNCILSREGTWQIWSAAEGPGASGKGEGDGKWADEESRVMWVGDVCGKAQKCEILKRGHHITTPDTNDPILHIKCTYPFYISNISLWPNIHN